jgi:ACS family tartrate transporter-like MFS transporter
MRMPHLEGQRTINANAAIDEASAGASELERGAFRKIASRFLPILTIAFFLNLLDRNNIGYAALTMNKEIALTATQFGYGAGIFFLGYCLFEIPSNLAVYRYGARVWIARIMITWGLISTATIFVNGPSRFYFLRFLLGVAEAGFFPGVAYFLGRWFPAEYRARMLAWFLVAIPGSPVIGGPISGLLFRLDGVAGLSGWKWLFVAEGIPSILVGIGLYWILRDTPAEAKWLSEQERRLVIARIVSEPREQERKRLGSALKDVRVLILSIVMLGFTIGSYAVTIWLPQIIKGSRFSNTEVGFLSAIPYFFACGGSILWAAKVDRSGKKIGNVAMACLVSTVGLVISVVSPSFVISMIGMAVALIGITSARAIFWTIPTRFLTGMAAAGGLAFINSVGTLGGFIGPSIMGWFKDRTGSFSTGLVAVSGFLLLASMFSMSLKLFVRNE